MAAGELFQQSPYGSQIGEDASLPFSFTPEPPDIRNWFSSYEYESPECSDVFFGLEDGSKDIFSKAQGKDCPIPHEEENLTRNGNLSFSEESSQNEYLLESGSSTPKGEMDLLLEEDFVLKKIQPNGLSSSLNYDDILITNKESHKDANHIKSQIGSLQCEILTKNTTSQFKREHNTQQEQECEDHDTYPENRNWVSLNSPPHEGTSNGEQTDSGFISTRNRVGAKRNAEMLKCVARSGNRGSSFEQQEKMSVCGKDQSFLARRALVDQTNVCFAEEAIASEAPGKWQCPRKSKPYAGPPLKQLRLERWVRRVL